MNEETLIADVKRKLTDLGALVDNDLPTYIVKLILNKHPIDSIRSDLSLFLDSETIYVPFMDWLEMYLSSGKKTAEISTKREVISANELEDELLDFEEDNDDQNDLIKNERLDDLNDDDQLISSTESTNKRKLEDDDLPESKKMMNNDKESVKVNTANVIKLTDNAHLNDIGLMRRKAMQQNAKDTTSTNSTKPVKQERQSTSNDEPNLDNFVDLREKLNSRKKNQQTKEPMDEEMDSNDDELQNDDDDDEKKERCKFWPFCKKEAECIYAHPTKQCKQFPSCKLGADKCLEIHPLCKFDLLCTKNDCPFLHIAKKQQISTLLPSIMPQPQVMHVECKFYPNCYNPNCPFIHPRLCNFGATCKNPTCTFKHPETNTNIAKPHQLKWTKSTSNNEAVIKNENEIDNQVVIKHENELIDDIKDEPSDELNDTLNDSNLEEYDDQMEIKIKAE